MCESKAGEKDVADTTQMMAANSEHLKKRLLTDNNGATEITISMRVEIEKRIPYFLNAGFMRRVIGDSEVNMHEVHIPEFDKVLTERTSYPTYESLHVTEEDVIVW